MLNDTNPIYLWTMAFAYLYMHWIFANICTYVGTSLRRCCCIVQPRAANILTSFIAHIPPNYMLFVVVFTSMPPTALRQGYICEYMLSLVELRHGCRRRFIILRVSELTICPHIIIIVIPVGKCGLVCIVVV